MKKKILICGFIMCVAISMGGCARRPIQMNNEKSTYEKEDKEEEIEVETEEKEVEESAELRPSFKEAMDTYEEFMNDYVDFMTKYQEAEELDFGVMTDYADFLKKYGEAVEGFSKWEEEELSSAELAYYLDVQVRVTKLLLEVAQ